MGLTLSTKEGLPSFKLIPIEKISISARNVRKTLDTFSGLDELAESIKSVGLQQPIVVFPKDATGKFELIVGQRRFLACRKIGLKEIPAIVEKPMTRTDALAYSFVENIHRVELDWKDKVDAALLLQSELGTVKAVAEKLNVSETTVRTYLGWAGVHEQLKEMVEEGAISRPVAQRIAKANPDENKAVAIAKLVKEEPRRSYRRAIIQTNFENPFYTPQQVKEQAPNMKFKHVTIDLSDKVATALQKASEKYNLEPKEIATEAVVDYLKEEGFYQGV
jgi:ParB/RepB/Spo0J family partition protein